MRRFIFERFDGFIIFWVSITATTMFILSRPYHVDSIRCVDKAGNVVLEGSGEVQDASGDAYIIHYQGLKMRISGATCLFKSN